MKLSVCENAFHFFRREKVFYDKGTKNTKVHQEEFFVCFHFFAPYCENDFSFFPAGKSFYQDALRAQRRTRKNRFAYPLSFVPLCENGFLFFRSLERIKSES